MSKFIIVYVDEEEMARDTFELYFEPFADTFRVVKISPSQKTINQIVDEVIDANPDIVVIDYYLKYSDQSVPANGDVILQRINDRRSLLPILIFTFYSTEAQNGFFSPDKKRNIHTKKEISDPKDPSFKNIVTEYIEYSRALLRNYKEEFAQLNKKDELTDDEQGRLNELDNILETQADVQEAFKPTEKSDDRFERIEKVISSTQQLLQTIKKKGKDE